MCLGLPASSRYLVPMTEPRILTSSTVPYLPTYFYSLKSFILVRENSRNQFIHETGAKNLRPHHYIILRISKADFIPYRELCAKHLKIITISLLGIIISDFGSFSGASGC